jgi:hypothetical protein
LDDLLAHLVTVIPRTAIRESLSEKKLMLRLDGEEMKEAVEIVIVMS